VLPLFRSKPLTLIRLKSKDSPEFPKECGGGTKSEISYFDSTNYAISIVKIVIDSAPDEEYFALEPNSVQFN